MTRGGADGADLSNKPKYSRFTQQELPSSRSVLTPGLVIMTYFSVGVAFIGIGTALLLMSGQVVEIVRRYDDFCIPPEYHEHELDYITNNKTPKSCLINITVPKFMMKPIFVYYEIENFYQNHRRYVKSRSDKQLQSKANQQELGGCYPEAYANNTEIVPCGLVAWSLFNDTYRFTLDEKSVPVNKSGISWSSDRKHKFGSDVFPKIFQNGSFIGGGKLNKSIPVYTRFTQQELPSSRPVLTPGLVIMTYFSVGVAFIGIGTALLLMSGQVVEIVRRYDDFCIPPEYHEHELDYITNNKTPKSCLINITVPKFMMKPIFVYYEIENFYQNHRRYVKSRSDKQLQSKAYEQETKECKIEADTNFSETVPCGLVAWSLFNDTYRFTLDEKSVPVNKSGISWSSDRQHKFGSDVFPKNFQNGSFIGGGKLNETIPLSKQEDLIVWMRIAALPTFRKMYGRIEMDIQANKTLTVVIHNNYNTYAFSGKKKLVLSTAGLMGGKNDFLGVAYTVVGAICLFLGITYTVLHLLMPLPHKDPSPRAAGN